MPKTTEQQEWEFTPAELKECHDAGAKWAKDLKVGDVFKGAYPAALAYVGKRTGLKYPLFLYAALDVLDTLRLYTDDHGVIVKIVPYRG